MFDIYAFPINFTVDNDNSRISNPFGGLVSIIFILLSLMYLAYETTEMYEMDRTSFSISSYRNETGVIKMKDFEDSFNMFIGTMDRSIDLFDNPYIQFNVYEFDQDWNFQLS